MEKLASAIAGEHMGRFAFEEIESPSAVIEMMRKHGSTDKYIKKVKQHALMRIENKRRYGFYSGTTGHAPNGEQSGMPTV